MNTVHRPGPPTEEPRASLSLYDYRRRVADLYAEVRGLDPEAGHRRWRSGRDDLFALHPQSALTVEDRQQFTGLPTYPYDPAFRFEAEVSPTPHATLSIPHSSAGTTQAISIGTVSFSLPQGSHTLTIFWLDQYGGGVFLPFRDLTNGTSTYGGGRYLLDSAKGADLGSTGTTITLDFNFAYHPSCFHNPRWSCPLAPASNRVEAPIAAGERI
jgi:uncharacterized protein (DUF1684 family)